MGKRAAREIDRRSAPCADEPGAPTLATTRGDRRRSARSTRSTTRGGRGGRAATRDRHAACEPRTKSRSDFDVDEALAETERCFSCGTCIQCDNCVALLPRPRGEARGGRLRRAGRLLQGLRPLRRRVPDRVDEDGRENCDERARRHRGARTADAADRQPRGRVGGATRAAEGGPGLSDHAADAGAGKAHRIPGRRARSTPRSSRRSPSTR